MKSQLEATFLAAIQTIELNSQKQVSYLVAKNFDGIQKLLDSGCSIKKISSALTDAGLKISRQTLGKYIHRQRQICAGGDANLNSTSTVSLNVKELREPTPLPPISVEKPKSMDEFRQEQKKIQAVAKLATTTENDFPEEVTRHKFFKFKGETLDVTNMNIDDYLTVSKNYRDGETIPDHLGDVVMNENMIRNLYERGLKNYGNAIVEWQQKQKSTS